AAIVFAPAGNVVLPALACLDRGGAVALAGIHMSPIPEIDYDTHLFQERDIHPVTANTRDDGRNLLRDSAEAGVRPHVRIYPLEPAACGAATAAASAARWAVSRSASSARSMSR